MLIPTSTWTLSGVIFSPTIFAPRPVTDGVTSNKPTWWTRVVITLSPILSLPESSGSCRAVEHDHLLRRDFLSYLIAGNLWPYGHCTAATRGIQITNPRVLEFERTVVHAEERDHHGKILQKVHDHVWQLIEEYGEGPIRRSTLRSMRGVSQQSLTHGLRPSNARVLTQVF